MGAYCDATDVQVELDAFQMTLGEGQAPSRAVVDGRYVAEAEARVEGALRRSGYSSFPLTHTDDVARLREIAVDLVVARIGRRMYGEQSNPDQNAIILGRERLARDMMTLIVEEKEPLATSPDTLLGLGAFEPFEQTTETTLEAQFTHDKDF